MKKTYYYAITLIFGLWIILSISINNSIILPSPFDVFNSLISILINVNSWLIILNTISRALIAIVISFLLALFLATLSFKNTKFKDFFNIFYIILKTIPNVAIMIMCLIWFGREGSIIIIVSLIIFPIMYSNILYALENIDDSLILITKTYQDSFFYKYRRIYLPLIKKSILESLRNTLSLALKVTVMSELLSQINIGIGKELYFYKINLEMNEIFAWTIIMILLTTLFDYIINKLINKIDY